MNKIFQCKHDPPHTLISVRLKDNKATPDLNGDHLKVTCSKCGALVKYVRKDGT